MDQTTSQTASPPVAKSGGLQFRTERLRVARHAAILGIVVNGGLALAKLIAGIAGNAYVLIADAVESLTDVFGSVAVWYGLRVAAQPPDASYPYGRGRAETLSAILVALTRPWRGWPRETAFSYRCECGRSSTPRRRMPQYALRLAATPPTEMPAMLTPW